MSTRLRCLSGVVNFTLPSHSLILVHFIHSVQLSSNVLMVSISEVESGINGMGDSLQAGKPSHCVTIHPGQLSLAIPLWLGTMSAGDSY